MSDQEATYAPPPISGYRNLSQTEVDLINRVKEHAEQTRNLLHEVHQHVETVVAADRAAGEAPQSVVTSSGRWLSIGQTDLQTGYMAVIRAIARPTTF